MINLKELKDNFNLEAVFSLNEPKEFVGNLKDGKEVIDRINLVLTQTFDAIGGLPFRQLIVKGKEKKVVIIYFKNNFIGIVGERDKNIDSIMKYIYQSIGEAEAREPKVEIKREKVKIEEIKEEEEIVKPVLEPKKLEEVIVKKEVFSPKVIEYIEEIARNYLGDFSLDIVSNVIEDSGIDRNKPTRDEVLGIAQALRDAASLIIGPSKAKKMKGEILKKIEEVE
ncbi:MAG: hypothetical protein ABIN61_06370 [candidate division WOR-3 bacterium]